MKVFCNASRRASQTGAALLIFMLIFLLAASYMAFSKLTVSDIHSDRQNSAASSLAQAKEALIGKAVSEQKNGFFGFLPTPDLGSTRNSTPAEGNSAGNFPGNAQNLSVIGRLPWKSLGLPPLRDANGECLWYAVSGSAQGDTAPTAFNWDTIGHFEVFGSDGTSSGTVSTTGISYHNRPLALIFSAGPPLSGQNRAVSTTDAVTECGGNYDVRNYLDSYTADANINSIVNYFSGSTNNATGNASSFASPKSVITGDINVASASSQVTIANDHVLTITPKELFDKIKKRTEFKADIDGMMSSVQVYLNGLANLGTLPATDTASGGKIDGVESKCNADNIASSPIVSCNIITSVFSNWKDNLLYAKPGNANVNGISGCEAVLFFGGERTSTQSRASAAEKLLPTNYLEGSNATTFPNNGNYTGGTGFASAMASADLAFCIKSSATQLSFASNFDSFTTAGAISAITTDKTTNPSVPTVSFDDSLTSSSGGCFWQPTLVPLAGKTLRAYYEFQLRTADTYADSGGTDNGNGFTFQMLRGDVGAPSACGTENTMGALRQDNLWGAFSYILETDVYRNSGASGSGNSGSDPTGNHTAIMTNGNLDHTSSGSPGTACDGSASGCRHSVKTMFEESPSPLSHKQRVEIQTGCNSNCTSCNPGSHATPNTYARITAWVDCTDCNDVVSNFTGELIAAAEDRDFNTAGHWTGSNWSVANGSFSHTAGATPATLPITGLRSLPAATLTYTVAASVTTGSAGTLTLSFGGASTSAVALTTGTTSLSAALKAVSSAALTITPDASWAGSLDNISITQNATVQRCTILNPEMNSIYFGLTGGFRSGSRDQGVTFKNFILRSD